MIQLTKTEALRIQGEQIDHYVGIYGEWVRAAVAVETTADAISEGPHDVVTINRHIPRGGFIEFIIERRSAFKTQVSDEHGD